ncbi:MAG: hypothetical protein ISS56_02230 [Anaerolineae bacterium]|nr:hypothetical protein [Anaerolineae bacterium]
MNIETIIAESIEPRLVGSLGREVANALLTQATICYVTEKGTERKGCEAFVRSICSDARVIEAWGAQATTDQAKRWKVRIYSGSDSVDEPEKEK